jgi:2-oxoglutarate ferredoxin oxidoreductase subunit beta
MDWIESNLIPKNKWDKLSEEERYELKKQGKFPRGILYDVEEPEYCEEYYKMVERVRGAK